VQLPARHGRTSAPVKLDSCQPLARHLGGQVKRFAVGLCVYTEARRQQGQPLW
jgi:hypothetical protein